MKRLLQLIGIRKWSGEDLVSLQAEPLKTIDAFFAEYGNCIFNGCEVSAAPGNTYNIAPGFVALQGKDQDNRDTFKVVPFAGLENATLPVYLTLSYNVIEKEYVDGKVKPVAYDYYAAATSVRPADETPYLEITASGGRRFIDAIGITQKLDKTGNGRDVTVTFNTAAERENVSSGDKLTTILGKVARWFSDLKAVAFSGKTADLTDDVDHRFTTDTEKVGWNDKYTKTETDNKDAAILTAAKNYTDALGGNVYKKTETYTRAETDTKVATLGNEVYRKGETYTRSETDAKDTAVLNTAKQYVLDRIAEIVGGSPAALDTLYEIAKALGNDPNFATSIMALVNGKAPLVHTHTKNQITDFPTSLPASDVYAWAKQPTKPAYNAGEVGAAPVSHNHAGTYAPVSHDHDTIKGNYTGSGGQQPPSYVPSGKVRFNMMNTPINGDGSYKDFLMMDTYTGSDVPVTTAFGISKSAALRAFLMQGTKGGSAWSRSAEIYTTENFNPSNYAPVGHNHAGTYAPASHRHSASQITEETNKHFLTDAERSKLAGIEQSIPDVKVKMSEGFIFIYHDELPEKFNDLEPQVVLLRCKKIYKFRKRARGAQKRWCDIKSCTIGLSQEINGNEYFKFQLSPGKWDLLRRLSGQVATVSELTNAFISRRINAEGIQEYVISFCTGKWKYATIGRNFIRKGLFALAIRVNNPDFPVNGFADGIPKYLYGNLTTFNLIFSTDHIGNCCTNLNLRS